MSIRYWVVRVVQRLCSAEEVVSRRRVVIGGSVVAVPVPPSRRHMAVQVPLKPLNAGPQQLSPSTFFILALMTEA